MKKLNILVCNDDGVYARGIEVLAQSLKKIADVTVVAPLEEKSTTGHSLTLHKPLRLNKLRDGVYGVNGSPADCVHLGISIVLKGKSPDLIVSGINRGANLGQDVYYSGTVSAAREATMMGIPALAVSLCVDFYHSHQEEEFHYDSAGTIARDLIKSFFMGKKSIGLPLDTLLNLNVPDKPLKKIKGLSLAKQGFRHYSKEILKRRDHRGKDYFWVGGGYKGYRKDIESDCSEVENGYATLTPLRLDTTNDEYLSYLESALLLGVGDK